MIYYQQQNNSANLSCLKASNCSSCIQILNCAWCLDEQFDSKTGSKCDYYQTLKDACPSNLIYNPVNTIEIIDKLDQQDELNNFINNEDVNYKIKFKDVINNRTDKISRASRKQLRSNKRNIINQDDKLVQLKPDKIRLKIRPNTKMRFNLTFIQAEKYPLDIYYLMDLTYSMRDHRDALIKLADKLSESMSDITTKFRLGYGSFIDKAGSLFYSYS